MRRYSRNNLQWNENKIKNKKMTNGDNSSINEWDNKLLLKSI